MCAVPNAQKGYSGASFRPRFEAACQSHTPRFYVAVSAATCLPMLILWFDHPHPLSEFSPIYAFLIFPLMLTGVVAFNVLKVVPHDTRNSVHILFTGCFFQGLQDSFPARATQLTHSGLGSFMTFFYICIYILRIIMVRDSLSTLSVLCDNGGTGRRVEEPGSHWRIHRMWTPRVHSPCNHQTGR
jgi:hypothetical protein